MPFVLQAALSALAPTLKNRILLENYYLPGYEEAVVGQQPWQMEGPSPVEPRGIQRHFERSGDVRGLHRGA